VNTIEGLNEELATEVVAQAEVMAEEQTDDLPRRKGGRAAAALLEASGPGDEPPSGPDDGAQPDNGEVAGESVSGDYEAPDENENVTDNHSSASSGDSIEPLDSALPAEAGETVEVDLPTDESTDSEADEASDNEIHDLALAVETSGFSPQGHEVTSRPTDDDQGETIRIVTEAVELGGTGREMAPVVSPAGAAAEPARPNPPNSSSPALDRESHEGKPQAGDVS
jgi:N utilization substance protein A